MSYQDFLDGKRIAHQASGSLFSELMGTAMRDADEAAEAYLEAQETA